jgi:hypothetical protein
VSGRGAVRCFYHRCADTASAGKGNEIYNRDAELAEDVERERRVRGRVMGGWVGYWQAFFGVETMHEHECGARTERLVPWQCIFEDDGALCIRMRQN